VNRHFSAKNISFENGKSQKSIAGRTEGPCSDTFQPKIFRLKSEKSKTIYHHIFIRIDRNADLRKMLRKYATNGNMSKNVLFRILRGTFETKIFTICD